MAPAAEIAQGEVKRRMAESSLEIYFVLVVVLTGRLAGYASMAGGSPASMALVLSAATFIHSSA